jgi:hypothetical protein
MAVAGQIANLHQKRPGLDAPRFENRFGSRSDDLAGRCGP